MTCKRVYFLRQQLSRIIKCHSYIHTIRYPHHETSLLDPVTLHRHGTANNIQQLSNLKEILCHKTTNQNRYHTYQLTLIQTQVCHILLHITNTTHQTLGILNKDNVHIIKTGVKGIKITLLKNSPSLHPIFVLFFWTGLRFPIECSLLGGGIPSQKSGYKGTRICTYIVLICYLVLPNLIHVPLSLPVPIPPPRFAPPLRPTPSLLSPSPHPSPILPAPTTAKTPTPLASEQTAQRGP